MDHSVCLIGVKAGWWLVRRESLKFLPGKSSPLHSYRKATHSTYWAHGPCPHSTDGAPPKSFKILTPKLAQENTEGTLLCEHTQVVQGRLRVFPLWLAAVCRTKAEAGQMAVTVTRLSSGCGPTRPMISWESTGDGSQPGLKVFEALLLSVNKALSTVVLWEDGSGVRGSPGQLAFL